MTPTESYKILNKKVAELIVKQGVQKNEDSIKAIVNAYIDECSKQSHYDQVANVNALVALYDNGDIRGFLSCIANQITTIHIKSDKDMMAWCKRN